MFLQPSQKSFRIKRILAKKAKQNRPIPQWIRLRTDNTIRCASRKQIRTINPQHREQSLVTLLGASGSHALVHPESGGDDRTLGCWVSLWRSQSGTLLH